ncbi:hypothetical protein [Burkholderia cenocepacia]|nr:hypothetical protein [Burkholderia cenocepacia]
MNQVPEKDDQQQEKSPDQAWEELLDTPESETFLNEEIKKAKDFVEKK